MRDVVILFAHLIATVLRLARPGGGVKEGDLIFVSEHPGSTDRLKMVSEIGSTLAAAIGNQSLMFEEHRLGNDGKEAAIPDS